MKFIQYILFLLVFVLTACGGGGGSSSPASNIDTTAPIIKVLGENPVTVQQNAVYVDAGATAQDETDDTVVVETSGSVNTKKIGTYQLTYTATDKAGNQATSSREIRVVPSLKVEVSQVQGNTLQFNSVASFSIVLTEQPTHDVVIPVESSDRQEGDIAINQVTFDTENWSIPQQVIVKGRNNNVIDGKQSYTIILGATQSQDAQYHGLDPEDVPMKGAFLKLMPPESIILGTKNLIPNVTTEIDIQTHYTGDNSLVFGLVNSPEGLEIDENTGKLTYTPAWSDKGTSQDIILVASDGELSEQMTFSVNILDTKPLQTITNGQRLTISDTSSELHNFSVEVLDTTQSPSSIVLEKLTDVTSLSVADTVSRLSDFIVVKDEFSGKLKITLPDSLTIPADVDLNHVHLYQLIDTLHSDGEKFWSTTGTDIDFKTNSSGGHSIIELNVEKFGGVYFIGLDQDSASNDTQNKALSLAFKDTTATTSCAARFPAVSCNPIVKSDGSSSYQDQQCTTSSDASLKVRIHHFGNTAESTLWSGTCVQELVSWLVEARQNFDKLKLKYDNSFDVALFPVKNLPTNQRNTLGFVTRKNDYGVLYLNKDISNKNIIRGTTYHEYFHHAQARSKTENQTNILDLKNQKWLSEGSARWFEDYSNFDQYNTYITKEGSGQKILLNGLNNFQERPYQRFSFVKLIDSRCPNLKNTFYSLINTSTNNTLIENLLGKLSAAGCSFGSNVIEQSDDLFLNYQYSTIFKDKMQLIDGNEPSFRFSSEEYKIFQEDWNKSTGLIDIRKIKKLPPYSARSFYISGSVWDDNLKNKKSKLKLTTSKKVLFTMISNDSGLKGNHSMSEGEKLKATYVSGNLEEVIERKDKLDIFVTLVNTQNSAISLSDFKLIKHVEGEFKPVLLSYEANSENKIEYKEKNPETGEDVVIATWSCGDLEEEAGNFQATINYEDKTVSGSFKGKSYSTSYDISSKSFSYDGTYNETENFPGGSTTTRGKYKLEGKYNEDTGEITGDYLEQLEGSWGLDSQKLQCEFRTKIKGVPVAASGST